MRKLIIKKERNLLLFSHVINDYPLLKKRLEKHTTIDEQILKKEKVFFASTFCRKLQVKNTECCIMENP